MCNLFEKLLFYLNVLSVYSDSRYEKSKWEKRINTKQDSLLHEWMCLIFQFFFSFCWLLINFLNLFPNLNSLYLTVFSSGSGFISTGELTQYQTLIKINRNVHKHWHTLICFNLNKYNLTAHSDLSVYYIRDTVILCRRHLLSQTAGLQEADKHEERNHSWGRIWVMMMYFSPSGMFPTFIYIHFHNNLFVCYISTCYKKDVRYFSFVLYRGIGNAEHQKDHE